MTKQKKKKKSYRDKQSKNNKRNKGFILVAIIAFDIAFFYAYMMLSEAIILKVYSPYYFVSSNYYIVLLLFFAFFIVTLASAVIPSFLRKELKKKTIFCSIAISIAMLIIITIFNCNIWSFNKDSFSYNTILKKDKIVYSYDDIDSIEMEENRYFLLKRSSHIDYTFYMNDGRKFKIDAYEAFSEDDLKLIEFDKAISNKRKIIGDYYYSGNASQELNDYYNSLFDF